MCDRRVTAYVLLLSIIAGLFFAGNISAKAVRAVSIDTAQKERMTW